MSYIQSNILTKHKKKAEKQDPLGGERQSIENALELTKILEVSDRNIRTVL